jgi:SnoaL-like polyketide cyclase
VIQLPTGTLDGKSAVRDNFVLPFLAGFPGNVHSARNIAHAQGLVAVEWSFEAMHNGRFAGIEPTGKKVQVPGCSFYEYDLRSGKIHQRVGIQVPRDERNWLMGSESLRNSATKPLRSAIVLLVCQCLRKASVCSAPSLFRQ